MRTLPLNGLDAPNGAPYVAVPRQIVRLSRAFAQARVLHSAVELRLFDLLVDGALTEPQIRQRLGLKRGLSRDLLDTLVGLGLLERAAGRRYRNSVAAAEYLVTGLPSYLGEAVLAAAAREYSRWAGLTEALLDGSQPGAATARCADLDAGATTADESGVRILTGAAVARSLDWLRYADFVDLGGGSGQVAGQVAAVHTHLRGFVLDRAEWRPAFDVRMGRMGIADRIAFHPGDPFVDTPPETDVVIFGPLRPDLPTVTLRAVLRRVCRSLRPGGAVLLYGALVGDRRQDAFVLLDCIDAQLADAGATVYAADKIHRVLAAAGFRAERVRDLDAADEGRVLIARKAAEDDR